MLAFDSRSQDCAKRVMYRPDHDFFGSDPTLMELHNFSQLIADSWFYFGPSFLLQLVYGGFGVRVLCVTVQPPKPTFFFDEIQDGLTNR